jgi:hypothetical protein
VSTPSSWTPTDALVAAAISWSADGAIDLGGLIATVDWLDHAVPLHAELTTAVGRLMGAGLLEIAGPTLRLTPAGRTVTDVPTKIQQRRLDTILVRLHDRPVPDRVWDLSVADYAAAVAEYERH